jgi:ketosteroid isomerase-like protein
MGQRRSGGFRWTGAVGARFGFAVVLASGLTLGLTAPEVTGQGVSEVTAANAEAAAHVRAREIAFAKTMEDRDHEAFATFISEEAVFFNGNTPQRGRAFIVEAWSGLFSGPEAPLSWGPDVVEVLASGALALSSGPVLRPNGEQSGRFNSVWRKEADGVWRVIFDKGS